MLFTCTVHLNIFVPPVAEGASEHLLPNRNRFFTVHRGQVAPHGGVVSK